MDAYYRQGKRAGNGKLDAQTMRDAKRKELGRLHAVASQKCLTELLTTTAFNFYDLTDLRLQFVDVCGATETNQKQVPLMK
jgi:hypothetical protein